MKKLALALALTLATTGSAFAQSGGDYGGGGYDGGGDRGYSERGGGRWERPREYDRRYGGEERRRDCRTYVTRERDQWGNLETRRVERCR